MKPNDIAELIQGSTEQVTTMDPNTGYQNARTARRMIDADKFIQAMADGLAKEIHINIEPPIMPIMAAGLLKVTEEPFDRAEFVRVALGLPEGSHGPELMDYSSGAACYGR